MAPDGLVEQVQAILEDQKPVTTFYVKGWTRFLQMGSFLHSAWYSSQTGRVENLLS